MRLPIVAALVLTLGSHFLLAQSPPDNPFDLKTSTGTIAGTLALPAATGRVPVALIIAGSGPTDRDGNSAALPGKNNTYKLLAAALASQGIASVRFDKRGIGASQAATPSGGEAALRFEHYIDDAAEWIGQLRRDPRFSRVIVIGHSEGSLVGMIAARKAKADAFVSLAGVGGRASDTIREQLRPQLATLPALLKDCEGVLASLEAGKVVDPLPPSIQSVPGLLSLFRPSVQPYVISWVRYDPSAEIAALTIPVLIVQGTHDIQVDVPQAKKLSAAKPVAELVIVDGMSHVLKAAPAERAANIATYGNPDLPIAPEVPRAIVAMVKRMTTP
jgi:pimeloyl-ACP methyl ester carboxylesterase